MPGDRSYTARVAFLHGRPGPHPAHAKYAQSIQADFHFVDFLLRWHDLNAPRWKRYLSTLICAVCLPNRRTYDLVLSEGSHFPPVVMKALRLLRPGAMTVALMADQTLFFLRSGRYGAWTGFLLRELLCRYDALVCVGQLQTGWARELLGRRCPRIFTTINAVPAGRRMELSKVQPSLNSKQVLFIANGPGGWRGWYKGIDLLLAAVAIARRTEPHLQLVIVGAWDSDEVTRMLEAANLQGTEAVCFAGSTRDLAPCLRSSALYVHCARGEAWGISILEAMLAGVPAIVSEWTGAREAVEQVRAELVVTATAEAVANRILWYFNLSSEDRQALSERARAVAATYTEERSVQSFQQAIAVMLQRRMDHSAA